MSNGDKILDSIKNDCDKNISVINAECSKACEEILAKGKAEADKAAAEINAKAQQKVAQMKAASKSGSDLAKRNALLAKKRSEINITIDKLSEYMLGLSDKEYFNIIYKFAKRLDGREGVILLNKKDLSRLPSDFTAMLKQNGVTAKVGKTAVDIDGGFILKCGDIEENMSFSAVIASKRDDIEDLINRELFA
ncbi:MAG: V-type ATP synthase subunit E [Ruminococcus sp.]|nr:V-type ATP synthase subunit E [Ruminococcus sp.]